MTARAFADPLRSLGFASISAAYAAVGSPLEHPIRAFCISNNTEGDLIFSDDNTVVEGKWFVAAGSFNKWDVQSNMNAQFDDKYVMPIGTQFYVKQLESPVSGAVYIEIFY
jgi:hypothetical protein